MMGPGTGEISNRITVVYWGGLPVANMDSSRGIYGVFMFSEGDAYLAVQARHGRVTKYRN